MEDGHAPSTSSVRDGNEALWPQSVQLARGRQPRDALAKTLSFDVASLDDFKTSLRQYLDTPLDDPEHTDAQLSFWIGASFLVTAHPPAAHPPRLAQQQHHGQRQQQQQLPQHRPHRPHAPPGYQPAHGAQQYGGPAQGYPEDAHDAAPEPGADKMEPRVALSIVEALQATADPKDKMRKQRAIAKCCVDAIQRTDGYRYSFHNCWNSREDDSYRFSYYCNDSLLNKDRAANGKGAKLGKRATKPVYDCKGVLSIKFSATKQSLDVFYKHVPKHKTYEERAPPPRKDSKRRKYLEVNDPDALERIAGRPRQGDDGSDDADASARPKKKKTAKPEPPKPSNTSLESDLRAQSLRSLLELIQVDPPAPEPALPGPLAPPPPPPPQFQARRAPAPPPPTALQHTQNTAVVRRRPRNSCDICKAKKTKCDGARPVCQTCIDKKRQCSYSEPPAVDTQVEANDVARQRQAPSHELSEYDKMKRELEEARARIQELESEKRASTTPVQTPQVAPRAHSQPQPPPQAQSYHQHQRSTSQAQPHAQPHPQQPHRHQLQQLNQGHARGNHSPQQMAYKTGTPPQQQRTLNAQASPQVVPPSSNMQAASQLQVAAQQLQTGQHPQQLQQTPQHAYFANTHSNHASYGRQPVPQNPIAQNTLAAQANNAHLPQAQTQTQTAAPVEYARPEFTWAPQAYYGYQSAAQQQQQQDQWAATRGSGVFR